MVLCFLLIRVLHRVLGLACVRFECFGVRRSVGKASNRVLGRVLYGVSGALKKSLRLSPDTLLFRAGERWDRRIYYYGRIECYTLI